MTISQFTCEPDDFSWVFAAGVPDPRMPPKKGEWANIPIIPEECWRPLCEQLKMFGLEFNPAKQVRWVVPSGNRLEPGTVVKRPPPKPKTDDVVAIVNDIGVDKRTISEMLADVNPRLLARIVDAKSEAQVKELGIEIRDALAEAGIDVDNLEIPGVK